MNILNLGEEPLESGATVVQDTSVVGTHRDRKVVYDSAAVPVCGTALPSDGPRVAIRIEFPLAATSVLGQAADVKE